MSRRGNCWDNSPQESFFGHMKDEIDLSNCLCFKDVKELIDDWIDYYNNDRYQWQLAKLSPNEYKDYCKKTSMTASERRALREWVKDGNSVYENSSEAWADGQVPVEFLTVYRDEEYIRQHTKGMTPEETEKFAIDYYYGPSINVSERPTVIYDTEADDIISLYSSYDPDEELPFK